MTRHSEKKNYLNGFNNLDNIFLKLANKYILCINLCCIVMLILPPLFNFNIYFSHHLFDTLLKVLGMELWLSKEINGKDITEVMLSWRDECKTTCSCTDDQRHIQEEHISLIPGCDLLPSFLPQVHDYCIRNSNMSLFPHTFQYTFILYLFIHPWIWTCWHWLCLLFPMTASSKISLPAV